MASKSDKSQSNVYNKVAAISQTHVNQLHKMYTRWNADVKKYTT
jgi:hypothetical protein